MTTARTLRATTTGRSNRGTLLQGWGGRRRFVAIVTGGLVQAQLRPPPASAAQFEYKYHHQMPVENPMHVRLVQLWSEVAQATNGRLVVRVFPNSALGNDAAAMTEIRAGAIQLASLPAASATELVPAIGILGTGFAFKSEAAAIAGIDGRLGDAIRREIEAKGFRVVAKATFELGMQQLTTSVRPIASPADLAGLKMAVAPSRQVVDLFRTLGSSPTPIDFAQKYTAFQTRLVDGTASALSVIEAARFFEVQRYLSITNHAWGGYWMVANPGAWGALPDDVQRTVERLVPKYIGIEHRDVVVLGGTLRDQLTRQGMLANDTDSGVFRARLGPYYARWKAEFGGALWSLLEDYSGGKLA